MNTRNDLPTIDPEFAGLLVPLTHEEEAILAESLKREGCKDSLTVWKGHGLLLDGHFRFRIAQANEQTNDLSGHRCDQLLPAFGLDGTTREPGLAGIANRSQQKTLGVVSRRGEDHLQSRLMHEPAGVFL